MSRLIGLYPRWWRERYGADLALLLEDLPATGPVGRLLLCVDIVRGALDARLTGEYPMHASDRAARRPGILIGLLAWAALSVEIVWSNVVHPSVTDDDGPAVLTAYVSVFLLLALVGFLAQRRAETWRGPVLAGVIAGALIGLLTIGTFAFVDNVFLDTVSRQQAKIDGFAHSDASSMRTYINLGLLQAAAFLTCFFSIAGAVLASGGAALSRGLRSTGSPGR
ncbi:hypothetical protein Lfu02_05160 [Longispora fulva]|uniref:Uncharacterized protein n=1 Tax=Longispora fulva TaxID=619741 RepID=A0A8J7KVR6_9ACTN|nr:hypothetical protein [Longispora fulva]MBG6135617.1 hypothetical protein [Longispora fulva]GIG56144.1 hypothetical protein Lfu02_05160 [Longispora fulva]